jgi:hypothetical protein
MEIKKMIEIDITDKMLYIASKKAKEMGALRGSITNGGGNQVGFLGECLVSSFFKIPFNNTYEYDFILPNGETIDVKTKTTTVVPRSDYDCSVAAWNKSQACDYYVFTRVKKSLDKGWILGYLPKDTYYKEAVKLKKGEVDPSNNFTVKSDCYNVKINQLFDINNLK